ncbi:MAG: CPBP family intramembrane metalloprotease [Paludibacteraceae bacterium]
MLKELFGSSGWLGKFIQLILISLLFLILGFLLWSILGVSNTDIVSQKIFQLVTALLFFILPVFFLSRFWYEKPTETYYLNKLPSFKQFLLVILLTIAIQPFINLLAYLNGQIQLPASMKGLEGVFNTHEEGVEKLTNEFLAAHTVGGYLFNLFVMAVIPAFGEELFFRGALQRIFSEQFSKHTSVWIVAIIFSFIHFQMSGFIPRMLLGAMFGYMVVWTRTLWLPMLAHLVNNGLGVTLGLFASHNYEVRKIEEFGKGDTLVYGILAGVVSIFIFLKIYYDTKKYPTE